MIHIYCANPQPATDWQDLSGETPLRFQLDPEEQVYTICCNTLKPAKDCIVYCYYDGPRFFCAEGKGCKDLDLIMRKKLKAFQNRSKGQKRRWSKRRESKA